MSAQREGAGAKSIAIIGMACRFPDADDLAAFWENLRTAKASFRDIPAERWNHALFQSDVAREHDRTYVKRGAFLDKVEQFASLHFGIAPRRVSAMDPQHRLLLEAVRMALQDAGLEAREFKRSMMGTFIGLSTSEYRNLLCTRTLAMQMADGALGQASPESAGAILAAARNVEPISAFSIPGTLHNMSAANIAHLWGLGGPAYAVDAACASALVAIYDAVVYLRAGVCDTALAGGVYLNLTPENLIGFARASAVSRKGECRPFDADSDGFLQGEGVGMIVLKRLDEAVRDGDRIYAVIRGVGINNDADTSDGPMAPSQVGQADCLRRAWADAGLDASTGSFFECHGTATKVGDPTEVAALRDVVLADGHTPEGKVWLSSVKGNIGHTMSAAGVAGLMRATLALHHQTIPPQACYANPNPLLELEKGPFDVPRQPIPWPRGERPRRAGISSFGFGGTNCHAVLEEAPERRRVMVEVSALEPAGSELFIVGAENRELLARHALELASAVEKLPEASLADLAYTLSATREHDVARLAVVATSRDELLASLRTAAEKLADPALLTLGPSIFATPQGVEKAPRIAFLYPGQGAQRVGLMRWMFDRFEGFRSRLKALEASLEGRLEHPLLSYLYPHAGNGEAKAAEERLQATEICQPVMAALGLALTDFLKELGIEPAVCAGHSLGEFVAASAGGILTAEEALQFVAERGRLMAALQLPDPGAMAAVRADASTVARFLQPGVGIANCNHPHQTVISGQTRAVEAAMEALKEAGVQSRKLRVSHAFHSELMNGVAQDLAQVVERLPLRAAKTKVVSAITLQTYPDSEADLSQARETFVRHATSQVDFNGALKKCQELGADFFLEVGAGNTLTSFVNAGLPSQSHRGASSLASAEDDQGRDFYRALGMLAVLGQPIHLGRLFPEGERQVVTLPSAPLVTERHWAVRESGSAPGTQPIVVRGPMSHQEAHVSDELVKLFREQTAILAQHAQILARQTAMLTGKEVSQADSAAFSAAVSAAAKAVPAPSGEAPKPVAAPRPPSGGQPLEVVLEAVAKISAFPKASLKPTQSLVNELGLDSLMLMELVSAVQAAFPGLGEIPQSMLNQKTTIADLVGFIEKSGVATQAPALEPATSPAVNVSPVASAAPVARKEELGRFRPVLRQRDRSAFRAEPVPADAWTLVTVDGSPLGEAIVARLAKAGRRVVAVELGKPFERIEEQSQVLHLSWPRQREGIDGLFAKLAERGIKPAALIHAAELGLHSSVAQAIKDGVKDWPDPVPLAQRLAANLHAASGGQPLAFTVVTSLGGGFGLDEATDAVWQVALVGFAKALSREWDAQVKAIDVDRSQSREALAEQIFQELGCADRDPEVGLRGGERHIVVLEPVGLPEEALPVDERSVILFTGGAGGIGARLALDLARRTRCSLVIADNREAAEGSDIAKTLEALRAAGSKVEYLRWDVRDPAIDLEKVRASLGPITGVIHCAGLIRDRRVSEKKAEELRQVMDVKVAGLLNVLHATQKDPLAFVVTFSSWAARFGNAGQTDYAAANELMNRLVTGLAQHRPGVRAASLAWPPWESSAMAQSIPAPVRATMKKDGIPFLSDEDGAAALRRHLSGTEVGELLISLGEPAQRREVRAGSRLTLETHPFLTDHRVKGTPVLPMASALEMLGSLAREQLGPGALEIRDLQLFNGVEVKGPVPLIAEAKLKGQSLQLELRSEGRVAYRAQAQIAEGAPARLSVPDGGLGDLPMTLDAFYREVAFHGPRLRGVERIDELGGQHLVGWVRPSRPADWMARPDRPDWEIDPLVIDSSFQLVLYWLWANHQKMALPISFRRLVQLAPLAGGPIKCTLVLGEVASDTLVGSIQYEDAQGRLLAVMTDARARVIDGLQPLKEPQAHGRNGNGAAASETTSVVVPPAGPIDERFWKIERFAEVEALYQRMIDAEKAGLRNPYFHLNDGVARDTSIVDGREMINFSGYNYLGLSGHPNVSAAAKAAVDRYGTSVSASRVASGEKPLHRELERSIAEFMGCEAAVVFSAGHMTNETVIGNLFGDGDLIVHDSLAHNSIMQGATLSGAKRRPFPHSDWQALDRLLAQLRPHYRKVMVAIEGVYSMDGDYPDLRRFVELREKHKVLLFVDEAHSMGVLGKTGRGVGEHFGIKRTDVDIWMGTLSKSFASCGGYIAGSQALIDLIKYTAPGFVYSAGLSPANAAAAKAAVAELRAHPELVQRLRERCKLFLTLAKERGIDTGMSDSSAVIPCIVGNSYICMKLSQKLAERGINVQPIVYPAVDEGSSRLRFFLSATHSEAQIRRSVDILAEELGKLRAAFAAHAATPA
jgi:8-amino-7-oxononanoate synthase